MTDTTTPVSDPQPRLGADHLDVKGMLVSTLFVVGVYSLGKAIGTLRERAKYQNCPHEVK